MSDLHARLLARITTESDGCEDTSAQALVDALRAVAELHAPTPCYESDPTSLPVCRGCELDGYDAEHPPYPCWTTKTIAEHLRETAETR